MSEKSKENGHIREAGVIAAIKALPMYEVVYRISSRRLTLGKHVICATKDPAPILLQKKMAW